MQTVHHRNSVSSCWLPLIAAAIGLSGALASGSTAVAQNAPAPLQKVRLVLDTFPVGTHTPFFVANDRGFYREAGLDVEITPGTGSAETAKLVGVERAQLGYADAGTMAIAAAADVPITMVAAFPQLTLLTIFSLTDRNIKTPKDLEGKSVGLPPGTAEAKVFPALAQKNGVDMRKIRIVSLSHSTRIPSLVAGNVDAIGGFLTAHGDIAAALKSGMSDVNAMKFSDHHIDMYGNGIIVNNDFAKRDPEAVERFVQATIRGLEFTLSNPEEALESTYRAIPNGDRNLLKSRWLIASSGMRSETTQEYGLGWMIDATWKSTQGLMIEYGGQSKAVDLSKLYTNKYLKGRLPPGG
jgi:NitT/TauT family transport system substrate-binding protein